MIIFLTFFFFGIVGMFAFSAITASGARNRRLARQRTELRLRLAHVERYAAEQEQLASFFSEHVALKDAVIAEKDKALAADKATITELERRLTPAVPHPLTFPYPIHQN